MLSCAQYGIEAEPRFGRFAHERLVRLAGKSAPAAARRKPGVYWPIWAASEAAAK